MLIHEGERMVQGSAVIKVTPTKKLTTSTYLHDQVEHSAGPTSLPKVEANFQHSLSFLFSFKIGFTWKIIYIASVKE